MFFGTPPDLLRPIHSLLKAPFSFSAGQSIALKLQRHLQVREDFEDLLALGCLFDDANQALKPSLVLLRARLEEELSVAVTMETDLSPVCYYDFLGQTPQVLGMNGALYLSYVSVQTQLERLFDHFELRRSGSMDPLAVVECAEALKLLMLSEALALALAGVASVKRNEGGSFLIVRNSAARDVLRNTWFARMADQHSHSGTLALAKRLASEGADHVSDVEVLIERILEQNLSLSWHRMSAEGRALKSVEQIHAAAGVVALLAVLEIRGKSLTMSKPDLSKHGLEFSAVAGLMHRQAGALVTDQFIMRRGDLLNVRIGAVSKGLRQLFRSWEIEFGERDALRIHAGGLFYEQTHIRQRIEQGDDYRPRYRVFDGFDRYQVIGGAPNECDVEFIIQDSEQRHYYFIQVKHALLGEKAFLESIVEAVQKDIGKGLHQLREAKRLLVNNQLEDTLKARGIADATPGNCSFVLLHNIAQFDFQQTSDGVSLYDWASFRNLLKDAECQYGHSDGPTEFVRLSKPLILTHPTTVIERLLSEHPAYRQVYTDPWAQERASSCYDVMGKKVQVLGLGI